MGMIDVFSRRLNVIGQSADHGQADVVAELELAQAEIARLRSKQQRPTDADTARSDVRSLLQSLEMLGDEGDDAWGRHAETERLRTSLRELCTQLEDALHAIRVELDGPLPMVEVDRRRRSRPNLEVAAIHAADGYSA